MEVMENNVEVREAQENREAGQERYRMPAADVYETSEAFVLMLDLPGVEKEGITLTHEKGELRVQAAVAAGQPSDKKLLIREVRPATFSRTFAIGDGIDTETIDARYETGVLTVKLYKSAASKARDIKIN
jgi:HSP20 family protein